MQKLNTEEDLAVVWHIRSGRRFSATKNITRGDYEKRTENKKV
jgi:hypothetical protein